MFSFLKLPLSSKHIKQKMKGIFKNANQSLHQGDLDNNDNPKYLQLNFLSMIVALLADAYVTGYFKQEVQSKNVIVYIDVVSINNIFS